MEVYFDGDIVELINLSSNQIYSIRSQSCDQNRQPNRDIIGMRYKLVVKKNIKFRKVDDKFVEHYVNSYIFLNWNHGGHFEEFSTSQFTLYKRPISNWIKYFKLRFKQSLKAK